jgi:hypothetical protein
MSFGDTRVLLATVLDSVTGVTGHTFPPAVVKAGSAWPRLDNIFRPEGGGDAWGTAWIITVVLGADERTAATFLDDLWPELVDELETSNIVYVTGPGQPVPLQASGTQMQALQLSVMAD